MLFVVAILRGKGGYAREAAGSATGLAGGRVRQLSAASRRNQYPKGKDGWWQSQDEARASMRVDDNVGRNYLRGACNRWW